MHKFENITFKCANDPVAGHMHPYIIFNSAVKQITSNLMNCTYR